MRHLLGVALLGAIAVSTAAVSQAQDSGAATYKAKCASCHGAGGSGNTPAGKSTKALPFKSPELVSASDDDLIAATKKGKGKMPAYSGKLSDDQIKGVVAYIRTLQK